MRKLYVLFLLIIVIACATPSGYPAASEAYSAESKEYAAARDYIRALNAQPCTEGTLQPCALTGDKWREYQQIRTEVVVADDLFYPLLVTWRDTGKKPANFETSRERLRAAQRSMARLAAEVGR